MARPIKIGLDYFNIDVDFFNNTKVRKIKMACGPQGITVLIYLLCNIYRYKGYYIKWEKDLPFLIADEIGVTEGAAKEVIIKAVQIGFFNERLFEKGFLTSSEIQERYSRICRDAKRTNWKIREEMDLLTEETKLIPEETQLPPPISTQSKGKESKEEKYIYTCAYTEENFLERWKKARLHFDNKPTNIKKLKHNDASVFKQLTEIYSPKDFDHAISGLFFQKTYPATRVNPSHFLENFETYLDCWRNKEKLFENKKTKKKEML